MSSKSALERINGNTELLLTQVCKFTKVKYDNFSPIHS